MVVLRLDVLYNLGIQARMSSEVIQLIMQAFLALYLSLFTLLLAFWIIKRLIFD